MLNAMRGKTATWLTRLLFLILILAFGAWGIGDIFRGNLGQSQIIDIDGKFKYSQQDFQRDLREGVENLNRSVGGQLTTQQFAALGGIDQIIRRALYNGLLRTYAHDLGLVVPLEEAIAAIHNEKFFQNSVGQFDRARFEELLAASRISESAYIEGVRTELRDQWVFDAYLASISAPSILVEDAFAHVAETRNLSFLKIPASKMNVPSDPTEDALASYFNAHKDSYKTPEYKSLEVIWLKPEDFAKNIEITDQEIASEYEARKSEFETPEKRDIEQIVLPSEDEAKRMDEALKKGGVFAEVVERELKTKPIQLGMVAESDLPSELRMPAFALKADEISNPIQGKLGFHIIHVKAITAATTKTLEDVKEELKKSVALAKAGDQLSELINQLEDSLAGGASMTESATKLNVSVIDVPAIDASGMNKDGSKSTLPAESIGLFWGEGNNGQVHQLSDGSYLTFQVKETIPSKDQTLDEAREKVKSDWRIEEQQKLALSKAQELASTIKDKADLTNAAKALQLDVTDKEKMSRADIAQEGAADMLAENVFSASIGQAVSGKISEDAIIFLVTGRNDADKTNGQYASFTEQMKQSLRNDLAQTFGRALEKQYPVTIRRDLADQLVQ